jgi:hypothetical protein
MHRKGLVAFATLSSLLLSGASSPSSCNSSTPPPNIGPSTGEIAGVIAGTGAVIAVGTIAIVEVHKSHHLITGCVTVSPDGINVHNEGDQKIYALTGIKADVKVGDRVKVQGNKKKRQKDSAGDEEFEVIKVSKDYGPCKAQLAASAAGPSSSVAQ